MTPEQLAKLWINYGHMKKGTFDSLKRIDKKAKDDTRVMWKSVRKSVSQCKREAAKTD